MQTIITNNFEETFSLASELATKLINTKPKIALIGNLGTGKTVFSKGFFSKIVPELEICSPTYTIINDYSNSTYKIYHCDLYRINSEKDLLSSGFFEIIDDKESIVLIEWADRLNILDNFLKIEFFFIDDSKRKIVIGDFL